MALVLYKLSVFHKMFYNILLPLCILSSSIADGKSSQSDKIQSSDSNHQAEAEHLDPEGFVFLFSF